MDIEIDGSYGEGGGSIVRNVVGLAVATGKSIRVFNIRKNRPQPGLKTQHMLGLKAVAELCNGNLRGAELGSSEIFFAPGKDWEKSIKINIPTAGSVGLVLQILGIACVSAPHKIKVEILGGASYGKWAPSLDYLKNVTFRQLEKMGYTIAIEVEEEGFYPVGGCKAHVVFEPGKLRAINLIEQGKILSIGGISIASKELEKVKVAERQKNSSRLMLFNELGVSPKISEKYRYTQSIGSGITLWAETSEGAILGSSATGERGLRAEMVGENAAKILTNDIKEGNTVDCFLADQLIPYIALCKEKSQIKHMSATEHTKTNIFVSEKFFGKKFNMQKGIIST